jgi:hypothetical protein
VALTPCFPVCPTHTQQQQGSCDRGEGEGRDGAQELLSLLGRPHTESRGRSRGSGGSAHAQYLFAPLGRSAHTKQMMTSTSKGRVSSGKSEGGVSDAAAAGRFISPVDVRGESGDGGEWKWSPNAEFSFGLSLLQADVLSLCIKAGAGLQPSDLFPPQALLLNLSLLHSRCLDIMTGRLCLRVSGEGSGETEQQQQREALRCWALLAMELQKVNRQAGMAEEVKVGMEGGGGRALVQHLVSKREVDLFRHRYEKKELTGRVDAIDFDDLGDNEVGDIFDSDGSSEGVSTADHEGSQMFSMVLTPPSTTTRYLDPLSEVGRRGERGPSSCDGDDREDDSEWSIVENDFL